MAYNLENYQTEIQQQSTITTQKNMSIGGTLSVTGASTFTGNITNSGSTTVSGNLIVSGSTTVTGNITNSGTTNILGNLKVTGSTTLTGVATIGDYSTGTIASGSATINAQRGQITTGNLTTGTAKIYSFDLVNNKILTSSLLFVNLSSGTSVGGLAVVGTTTIVTAGSATISIVNADCRTDGTAFNGTIKVNFVVL